MSAPQETNVRALSRSADPDLQRDMAMRGAAVTKAKRSVSIHEKGVDAGVQVRDLFNAYAPLAYLMPWDVLDYVELLATYNPDYSQAVENIKMLANTGHTLQIEGKARVSASLRQRIDEKARTIQERHGGIDGLIEKLLDQAATFGAMCGEWIVDDDLEDVVDFIDVNPKSIRFFWEDEHWAPYQQVNARGVEEAKARGQKIRNSNCIKLNELTFHYYAFDAAPGSPYGTPPFLAALTNIAIQRDMVNNLAQIVKKIGLLGVVDLTVKGLPMKAGETQEAYESRAGAYLDAYVTVIEDMIKDGGIVHFDDVEAKTWQIGGNAAGATAIFKQNEELIFSGLKSMPSVQGRSYSTTETYAGVAYEIILRNTAKYQRAVRRMIEGGYWLMATVWGETPDKIKLKFNNNKTLQRLQDAQAEKVEISNAILLWLIGMINQQGVAQRLGFTDPATPMEEPPEGVVGSAKAEVQAGLLNTDFDTQVPSAEKMEESDEEEEEAPQPEPQPEWDPNGGPQG